MSIVAYDGKSVFYDSICVASGTRQLSVPKVHVSNCSRYIACGVGLWGHACSLFQTMFDALASDAELSNKRIFIPAKVDVMEEGEYSGGSEYYIIDTATNALWLYDDHAYGFCRSGETGFIIGHERAAAIVSMRINCTDENKWASIASDLSELERSPYFNDRVTAAPYYVYDVVSGQAHSV